jgi:hypothetical protein
VTDPQTPAEWQEAVNAAEACLLLESARVYGLVVGGPIVKVARCDQILAEGRRRQIHPESSGVEAYIATLARQPVPAARPEP